MNFHMIRISISADLGAEPRFAGSFRDDYCNDKCAISQAVGPPNPAKGSKFWPGEMSYSLIILDLPPQN